MLHLGFAENIQQSSLTPMILVMSALNFPNTHQRILSPYRTDTTIIIRKIKLKDHRILSPAPENMKLREQVLLVYQHFMMKKMEKNGGVIPYIELTWMEFQLLT